MVTVFPRFTRKGYKISIFVGKTIELESLDDRYGLLQFLFKTKRPAKTISTCQETPRAAQRITSLMVKTEEGGAVFRVALAELSTGEQLC